MNVLQSQTNLDKLEEDRVLIKKDAVLGLQERLKVTLLQQTYHLSISLHLSLKTLCTILSAYLAY